MNALQRIDEIIAEQSLLKHPFYEMWSAGDLSIKSLAGYSKEYFQLVRAVPSFMGAVIEKAPKDSPLLDELAENRQEEFDHIKPWTGFAAEIGVPADELVEYEGLPKTRTAVNDLGRLVSDGGFEAGAAAMYAFEKEIPKISQTKLEGLASFYGVDGEEATRYFRLHTEADIRHAALWRGIIEESAGENLDAELVDAAGQSVSAQNLLLDACYEEYCS